MRSPRRVWCTGWRSPSPARPATCPPGGSPPDGGTAHWASHGRDGPGGPSLPAIFQPPPDRRTRPFPAHLPPPARPKRDTGGRNRNGDPGGRVVRWSCGASTLCWPPRCGDPYYGGGSGTRSNYARHRLPFILVAWVLLIACLRSRFALVW